MDNVRRVLLVSENPAVAKSLEEALSAKGIGLAVLPTAEEALWMLEEESFDAVLAQAGLRGMSGLEMAEELHGREARLPVYLIAREATPAGAGEAGLAGRVQEPLTSDRLAGFADQILSAARPAGKEAGAVPGLAGAKPASRLRDIVLFLLGPVFALGYIIAFPVVGLGMLIYSGFEAQGASAQAPEAAPPPAGPRPSLLNAFGYMVGIGAVGVFYGLVAPFLGIVLVVWFGLEAWRKTGARAIGSGKP